MFENNLDTVRLCVCLAAVGCALACPAPQEEHGDELPFGGIPGVDAGSAPDAGPGVHDDVDAGNASADDAGVPANSDAGVVTSDAGVVAPDAGTSLTAASCFSNITSETGVGVNYDQFSPVVGSHCMGTNQQDIEGIERVVFLGDSVTVGTPPNTTSQIFRAIVADRLVDRFQLEAPSALWKSVNPLNGVASVMHSGAFWSCAKWGARTDDLMADHSQINDCFPAEERNKHTLVIMTMGGNDIAHITKAGADGEPVDQVRVEVEAYVQKLRDALHYLKDPTQFPGGVDVIFSNNFEFTDGSGDVSSCPAAAAAGFDKPWDDPHALAELVVWATEQYMEIAVETHSDLMFTLETFCGHGYHNDDATNGCFRGPDTPRWFDLTCIHPNPEGHAQIADEIMAIVNE